MWDSFEFEKASRISRYLFSDPCAFYARSYYGHFWCDLCNSSDHDINSCPYYVCYAQPNFAPPMENTKLVLTLHDSSFPLAKCMGLEVGELFGVVATFSFTNACFEPGDTFDEVHDLDETPFGRLT